MAEEHSSHALRTSFARSSTFRRMLIRSSGVAGDSGGGTAPPMDAALANRRRVNVDQGDCRADGCREVVLQLTFERARSSSARLPFRTEARPAGSLEGIANQHLNAKVQRASRDSERRDTYVKEDKRYES